MRRGGAGIMMTARRLASGGVVDRARPCSFTFDGKLLNGYHGDSLASALLANGVTLVGRSFKYHRPRGILSAGSEEPNGLVELRGAARREPNCKSTMVELFDGLQAMSQNRWPSLKLDLLSAVSLLSPMLAAGFYYKTFMWPAAFWEKLYEPAIRRAAGLGRGAALADPDSYEKAFGFCDLLVIGSGPSGLIAALTAARAGARVILCDEDFVLGGRLLGDRTEIEGQPGDQWRQAALEELASCDLVTIMPRSTVFGVYDHGAYGVLERTGDHLAIPPAHTPRQRLWRIVAKRALLAAGAVERPIVFGGNDRPGVMLAGAVRTYVNRFAALPCQRLALFTTHDDGWKTAIDCRAAGIEIAAIIDSRSDLPDTLSSVAKNLGAPLFAGGQVIGSHGRLQLEAIDISGADGKTTRLAVDGLAMSGGWNPTVHLTCHHGGRPIWNEALSCFVPGKLPPGMRVAGSANGRFDLAGCLKEGAAQAIAALGELGFSPNAQPLPQVVDETNRTAHPLWQVTAGKGKAFVDFQHDVTRDDVVLAYREGFRSVEHLKRYTTLGMATDQGKTANLNGLAIMADLLQRPIAEVGTTLYRPPYTPVAIGAFAGHHRGQDFRATRLTPSHVWAAAQGALFVETGQWLRAQYFPQAGEQDWLVSVNREVMAVRSGVGVCDVSTLGKIDIQGSDAGIFLDRVYINSFSTLAIGKTRYGVMLREDGIVMDDGTTARLGPDHFLMSTTTANAAKVMQHLEFCHQVLWPKLDVQMVSVTEQWAQFSVAGPRARELIGQVVAPDADLSQDALPFMGAVTVRVDGVKARLFRISFSGELAYEIAVPARYGNALMQRLCALGAVPYGTEALGVMRIEKGHPAGNELNGTTTARDLGMGRMLSTKKDFIGRVMADRPGLCGPERLTLVGVKPLDPGDRLRAGAHFLPVGATASAENDQGYLTSAAFSPSLGHWIGLALISAGPSRIGEKLRAYDPVRNGDVAVELCSPVFIDPDGERVRG